MPFVAEPDIQSEIRPETDPVLDEEGDSVLDDATSPLAEGDAEGVSRSAHECRDAGKIEHPGSLSEVVVEETPVFTPQTQRLPGGHVRHRVVDAVQRIDAALREDSGSAEVEPSGDDHLRQSDRAVDPDFDPEIRWIELRYRKAPPILAALAESHLVQQARSKDVRLGHGDRIFRDVARLTEPRDAVPLRAWLDASSVLPAREQLEAVAAPDTLPDVERPVVRIDGGVGCADESWRPVRIEMVRPWNQLDQPADDGIGGLRALSVAEHEAVDVESLSLTQSFIHREEAATATQQRTTQRPTKFVALERMRGGRREFEEVPGIECVVAEELVDLAAERLGARSGHQVHDRPRHMPEFRTESRAVDLEFLDARDGRRIAE